MSYQQIFPGYCPVDESKALWCTYRITVPDLQLPEMPGMAGKLQNNRNTALHRTADARYMRSQQPSMAPWQPTPAPTQVSQTSTALIGLVKELLRYLSEPWLSVGTFRVTQVGWIVSWLHSQVECTECGRLVSHQWFDQVGLSNL